MSEWMGAEDHVNKALEHYERGRWADAEAELRKALASEPDRGEWQFNLGLTLEAAGRPGEAFDCYSRASELMPEEADPLLAAGTIANRLGRHEDALGLLARAVRLRREDDTAHAVWIDSLVCLGRLDEAETTFHLARQSVEECPRSLAAVAEALIRRGQLARAEWCLREAMRLEPGLARVRARLAAVVAEHGGVERAIQLYLRELRDDPGAIDTQLDFADLLLRLGRLPEASERYRRVLELEPANVDAHLGLGRVAIRTGRFDQAILELELVAKLDGAAPQVRLDLAEALLGQDRVSDAAARLGEELELLRAGECDTDRARLGMLLLRAGRPGDAIPLLEEVAAAIADASPIAPAERIDEGLEGPGPDRARPDAQAQEAVSGSAMAPTATSRLEGPDRPGGSDGPNGPNDPDGPNGEVGVEGRRSADARKSPSPGVAGGRAVSPSGGGPALVEVLRQLALAKFTAGDLAGGVRTSRRILRADRTCVRSLHNLGLAMLRTGHPRRAAVYVAEGLRVDRHDDGLRRLRARVWASAWTRGWSRLWSRFWSRLGTQQVRGLARAWAAALRGWLGFGWMRRS